MMFYIGVFLLSWLAAGFIGAIPTLLTKDVGKSINDAAKGVNIQEQSKPKLFFLVCAMLCGYFTMYLEIASQFRELAKKS